MRKYVSTETLLRGMGENVLQAAKAALAKGAEEVVAEAKSRCPVYKGKDRRVTPGALRDSIHAEKKRSGTLYRISAGAKAQDGTAYGKLVEFSPKINKPFLYPALDARRDGIRRGIVEAVKAALRRNHS